MYKFLVIVAFLSIFIPLVVPKCDEEIAKQNDTECNYPYGDEAIANCDMKDPTTNSVLCEEDESDKDLLTGKCPSAEKEDGVFDPYTKCGETLYAPDSELLYSTSSITAPQVQCKKCDLRLTPDKEAVIVECFSCFDIPSPKRPANRTEKDIIYKVYYIQVANYTSVEVTGKENF